MSLIMQVLSKSKDHNAKPRPKVPLVGRSLDAAPDASILTAVLKEHGETTPLSADMRQSTAGSLPVRRKVIFVTVFSSLLMILALWLICYAAVNFWTIEKNIRQESSKSVSKARPELEIIHEWNEDRLDGILLDYRNPMCIINGKVFRIGDSWKGKTIASINQKGVTFVDQSGAVFMMKIPF